MTQTVIAGPDFKPLTIIPTTAAAILDLLQKGILKRVPLEVDDVAGNVGQYTLKQHGFEFCQLPESWINWKN